MVSAVSESTTGSPNSRLAPVTTLTVSPFGPLGLDSYPPRMVMSPILIRLSAKDTPPESPTPNATGTFSVPTLTTSFTTKAVVFFRTRTVASADTPSRPAYPVILPSSA